MEESGVALVIRTPDRQRAGTDVAGEFWGHVCGHRLGIEGTGSMRPPALEPSKP